MQRFDLDAISIQSCTSICDLFVGFLSLVLFCPPLQASGSQVGILLKLKEPGLAPTLIYGEVKYMMNYAGQLLDIENDLHIKQLA